MARSKKPYPGMGQYVVVCLYHNPDTWIPYAGAQSFEKALKLRKQLPQWPDDKIKIVRNEIPS